MTDREMLEWAAKAVVHESWHGNEAYMRGRLSSWNPLEDDGDALRLAVDLGLDVVQSKLSVIIMTSGQGEWLSVQFADHNHDKHAATRRAITMAAAQIGKEMSDA